MSWFTKLFPAKIRKTTEKKNQVPDGIWSSCPQCHHVLYRADLVRNLDVCPKCDYHVRIDARTRLNYFFDENSWQEIGADIEPSDPLKFRDSKKYKDRLIAAQKATGEKDALIVYQGLVKAIPMVAVAFEFGFIGGSMGAVVGKKFVMGVDAAIAKQCAFVCFATSGGARMQESVFSLLQMAKTSAALGKLADAGLPFISVMTDPTYGGVSASLAMLGDVNIAEPRAMIGFAGPRVIEQTVRETLPQGFQQSEFLLEHGFLDQVIDRRELRDRITALTQKFLHQSVA
jgi:acetyl-CoA carboxylase carboxyl transferase subunit beta